MSLVNSVDTIVYKSTESTLSCTVKREMSTDSLDNPKIEKSMVVKGLMPNETEFDNDETLSTLSLVCLPDITNVRLEIMLSRVPNLTSLALCKLLKITDDGLTTALNQVKDLRTLHIGHVDSITDKGLQAAAEQLILLDSLRLWYLPNISDKGLTATIGYCRSLITLFLWQLPKLTNRGLKTALSKAKLVRDLTLRDLPCVDGQGIVDAYQGKYIRRLVLWNLLEFTDQNLIRMMRKSCTLKELHLKSLEQLTGKGITTALNSIPTVSGIISQKLTVLVLDYLKTLTTKELEQILRAVPGLLNLTLICLPGVRKLKSALVNTTPQLIELHLDAFPNTKIDEIRQIVKAPTKARLEILTAYNMDSISKKEMDTLQAEFKNICIQI